jgi:hypothetical protein
MTAQHYPFLVRHCLERNAEIIAHGISATRVKHDNVWRATGAQIIDTIKCRLI